MNKKEYVSKRFSYEKDDRTDDEKLHMDARLRGSIGAKEADVIINMINDYKSRR